MIAPLLAVDGLRIATRGKAPRTLVDGVSFTLAAGERLALVGESGSGKSLTALAVMGLLPDGVAIADGAIRFDGADLRTLPEPRYRELRGSRMAMVFQEPLTALNPGMRIGDQVAEVLVEHRGATWAAARAEAVRLLESVEIRDAATRSRAYPHQFSGGMRQRVMIAMALACQPRLLVCDEPTTALDVTVQAQIMALLDRLQREHGTAILFISHNLALVADFCDRIAVMKTGRIVESGDVRRVLGEPSHEYTRHLLECLPPEVPEAEVVS